MSLSTSLTFLISPVLFFLLWYLSSTPATQSLIPHFSTATQLRGKRIILLIAHPDDEAMFFSPTLLHLTHPALGNHLKILCLSTGNAANLGQTRKKELLQSAQRLGLRRADDVFILDDQNKFPDSMSKEWDREEIAAVLASAFTPQKQGGKENGSAEKARRNNKTEIRKGISDEGPQATIDVLITFDAGGVSGHPNHRSLYFGARTFLSNLMRGKAGWRCPVELYTLASVNLPRKYSFILDAPITMIRGALGNVLGGKTSGGDRTLFVSGLAEYWKARGAMVDGHKSQMVWFRWGWITMGRYMVVNDLKREKV
ncbi:MAG: hypothetical protein Q9227_000858 [Pyrenula ochraceoflavens]